MADDNNTLDCDRYCFTHTLFTTYAIDERMLNAKITFITFRVSRRRREMYSGHVHLCVCLCVCPRPHAYTIARTRM